jgi:hypothetical protein
MVVEISIVVSSHTAWRATTARSYRGLTVGQIQQPQPELDAGERTMVMSSRRERVEAVTSSQRQWWTGVDGAATAEEGPSAPSVPALIYPYPHGSASGSSTSEGGLPSPYSQEREGRRQRRRGRDGRREHGSPSIGDWEGRGTWGREVGDVKLGREYDV